MGLYNSKGDLVPVLCNSKGDLVPVSFYNSKGELTPYSFACGYIQVKDDGERYVRLFMTHGVYHLLYVADGAERIWESFRSLTKARARYRFYARLVG